MDFIMDNLLSVTIFAPLIGAAIIILLPKKANLQIKLVALIASLVPLICSVIIIIIGANHLDASGKSG